MSSKTSLSTKIILMVEIMLICSSLIFCSVSIYRARIAIRQSIQQRMLDIANCASGSVNGDILENLTADDAGTPEYQAVFDALAVFRDNVELEYVYGIKDEGDGRFTFTVDADLESPGEFGSEVEYTKALAQAARGLASVDEVPYTDDWGTFYSAYSPVLDSKANIAGIVAVDFSEEWFETQLRDQTRSTVISYAIILLITILVAGILAFLTVRPYIKLQERLLEDKITADKANTAKSDFLANMSHEIRTPINAVLGMNEIILRESRQARDIPAADAASAKAAFDNISVYASDVESAGHNLLAIVNDILDFSKIEAGKMDLVEAPYQLSSILNDLSNMILFKVRDKGLDFILDIDESLPDGLFGDEVRVRQVMTNILNNAVKYTASGSVTFKLRGERDGNGGILMTADIIDTGQGIRKEDLGKLFTQFQRLDLKQNSTVEGTGLGLAITRKLVDMMRGEIKVESEYGKGSTFTVSIPQGIVSEEPVGDFQKRFEENVLESKAYNESFRAPDARILIVDDTRMNLTVAVSLLKSTKLMIDTAESGQEAIELAAENAYDVILMDQRMPVMGGTETLHRIREDADGPNAGTPVICLTADAVIGAKERYIADGFSDYLTKPVDSHALEKMLMKYLPKDKITYVTRDSDAPAEEPAPEGGEFAALASAGIDAATGIRYAGGDGEFYRSLLSEYVKGSAEKDENLRKYFEAQDWDNYAINVHALKSMSKMIGAGALSEAAAKLEAAANAADGDTVRAGHDKLMTEYATAVSAIRSFLPEDETVVEDDDEVLEFTPE